MCESRQTGNVMRPWKRSAWAVGIVLLAQSAFARVEQPLPCLPGRFATMCRAGGCQTNTGYVRWAFELLDNGRICPAYPIPNQYERGCELRCGKLRQKRDGTLRVRWGNHCRTVRPTSEFNTWQKYRGVVASDCNSISGRIVEKCTCEGSRCSPGGCTGSRYPVNLTRGFCGDGIIDTGFGEAGMEECEPGVVVPTFSDGRINTTECTDPGLVCRDDCTCIPPS